MNITTKPIITDTNIITDLNNAHLLEDFIKLDNVYISDMIKNDEINSKTGNVNLINQLKVVPTSPIQLIEMSQLSITEKKLSIYDILNYIIARDTNSILATGDNRLKKYAEKHRIEVFRTLKIIKLMEEKKIISCKKAINACNLLKKCPTTRIPETDINNLINSLNNNFIEV